MVGCCFLSAFFVRGSKDILEDIHSQRVVSVIIRETVFFEILNLRARIPKTVADSCIWISFFADIYLTSKYYGYFLHHMIEVFLTNLFRDNILKFCHAML